MDNQFDLHRATRQNILGILEESSSDALLTIPKGFNNNILWNTLHVMASQQLLIYGLSQTPFRLDKNFVLQFKNGTKPNGKEDLQFVAYAKQHLLSTVDQLSKDYQDGIFGNYKTVELRYGVDIQNFEQAFYFNNIHEAMHYGQIKMLQKLV